MLTHDFDYMIIRDEVSLVTQQCNRFVCNLPTKGAKPKYADLLHLPHGLKGYFDGSKGWLVPVRRANHYLLTPTGADA